MSMASSDRIAMVTGAGSGIGREVALALMGSGYKVVLAGRRPEALQETAAAGPAGHSLAVPTDVTDPASVDALFAQVKKAYGRLDILFNNAGTGGRGVTFDQLTVEDWKRVVDVNLTGMFLCAQGAFRLMKDQDPKGGRIINNGSISAHAPRPNSAPYTSTKHGVTGLTKSIALDGRIHDIACGQIDIGNAGTAMTKRMTTGVPQANGTLAVEPVMEVSNVAKAVLFMADLPADANALFLTVMATKMPLVGRG
jgi:NAD(P)-dependent dehydrogenase (short-subunit alcohol dehydrogenase family)